MRAGHHGAAAPKQGFSALREMDGSPEMCADLCPYRGFWTQEWGCAQWCEMPIPRTHGSPVCVPGAGIHGNRDTVNDPLLDARPAGATYRALAQSIA